MIDLLKLFSETYPSYMRGDKPLEPYYSFFCEGFCRCQGMILSNNSKLEEVQFLISKIKE